MLTQLFVYPFVTGDQAEHSGPVVGETSGKQHEHIDCFVQDIRLRRSGADGGGGPVCRVYLGQVLVRYQRLGTVIP